MLFALAVRVELAVLVFPRAALVPVVLGGVFGSAGFAVGAASALLPVIVGGVFSYVGFAVGAVVAFLLVVFGGVLG